MTRFMTSELTGRKNNAFIHEIVKFSYGRYFRSTFLGYHMPTAPKLIAALWFCLLGWFATELVKNYLPDGTQFGLMSQISAFLGFIIGWRFMGMRAGDTVAATYAYGLSASILLSFWTVFYFAFEEMIHRALKTRYDGPTNALLGMVDLGREYAIFIVKPDVFVCLIIGGLFGGWLTDQVSRRWS